MNQFNTTIQIVKLDTDQYAQIDPEHNLVTVHYGSRTGTDQDWGGACVASLQLDQALAIAEAIKAMFQPSEAAQMDAELAEIRNVAECHPTEDDEDAWILDQAAWFDERRETMYDLVSAGFGHD